MNIIRNTFNGSVIRHSSKNRLKDIKILIPKNHEMTNNLDPIFREIDQLKNEIIEHDKLFNQLIKQLEEESIKNK